MVFGKGCVLCLLRKTVLSMRIFRMQESWGKFLSIVIIYIDSSYGPLQVFMNNSLYIHMNIIETISYHMDKYF